MLADSPELLGAGVLAGLVTIVVTGLRCMTRPGLPLKHAKLTARQTLLSAGIFIAFLYGLIWIAAALGHMR